MPVIIHGTEYEDVREFDGILDAKDLDGTGLIRRCLPSAGVWSKVRGVCEGVTGEEATYEESTKAVMDTLRTSQKKIGRGNLRQERILREYVAGVDKKYRLKAFGRVAVLTLMFDRSPQKLFGDDPANVFPDWVDSPAGEQKDEQKEQDVRLKVILPDGSESSYTVFVLSDLRAILENGKKPVKSILLDAAEFQSLLRAFVRLTGSEQLRACLDGMLRMSGESSGDVAAAAETIKTDWIPPLCALVCRGAPYCEKEQAERLIRCAQDYVGGLKKERQAPLFVRLALLSLVFGCRPKDLFGDDPARTFPDEWIFFDAGEDVIDVTQRQNLEFSLTGFQPGDRVRRVRLYNPSDDVRQIGLRYQNEKKTVRMPKGSSLLCWFVGDKLTCLKGSFRQTGTGWAAVMHTKADAPVVLFDPVKGNAVPLQDAKHIADRVVSGGVIYTLRGSDLTIASGTALKTKTDVIGVFAADAAYVLLHADGSTESGIKELNVRDAVSVLAGNGSIVIWRRNGKAAAVGTDAPTTAEAFFKRMTACFPDGEDAVAQREPDVNHSGKRWIYTSDGEIWLEEHGKGGA